MELRKSLTNEGHTVLAALHNSFHHHSKAPNAHRLRLFISSVDTALETLNHLESDLKALRARAVALLDDIQAEDAAVDTFNRMHE